MNEQELKEALKELGGAIDRLLRATVNEVDNQVVQMLFAAIDSPLLWPVIYRMLSRFLAIEGDGEAITMSVSVSSDMQTLEEETEMDPATIIAIISAIVQLIRMWRNR